MPNEKILIDPITKNEIFDVSSPFQYLQAYVEKLSKMLKEIPEDKLQQVFSCLRETAKEKRHIFVAGNGGSCAIASHLCCDWMKGSFVENEPPLQVQALTENTSLLTAIANDMGYEQTFSKQLEWTGAPGDVVVLISSSGNSPNVVRAAETARKKKMKVISFTGFEGGKLQKLSDINLHIPASNYGIAEDSHQILMHVISQFLYKILAYQK